MGKEHKKQYDIEYQAVQTRRFVLNLNRKTRPRLIAYMEAQPNLTKFIIGLIEDDMLYRGVKTDWQTDDQRRSDHS